MGTFGEWLRLQRSALKLTRDEFANRIGCSVSMLRKMEDDERRPSTQIAELIANCLDIPEAERQTFIRVARGELSMERLTPVSRQTSRSGISPAQVISKTNLPVLPTPLIGRQHEVDELHTLLHDPQCRMVTLVGPGGIGKTRLAIETASGCEPDFADGVYFVALASVHVSRLIIPVIADSIGFVFQSESSVDPKLQLLHYLGKREILLVIDNLEHLLSDPEVVELFPQLIQSAANLKLLITSRESLGLQDEWVFDVHGLPIPEGLALEGTAVELFLQRARRVQVGFDATTEDVPAILRICRMVNGMPLGIELAAAWVRTLTCEEIAREIERGLDFLSVSARDLPGRHRSLRAVFDHSWKLLLEEEQNVLLRLSIFQGGFSRDAAQHIAGATLPILSALVTKSLIRRSSKGRYDLHELIRQYAFEQLVDQPQVQEDAQALHGNYFMMFLRQRDEALRSPGQRESLSELTAEIDNIRSAQEWAIANQEFALIETALRAYSTFIHMLGWAQEALAYLGRVQEALECRPTLSRTEQVALAHVLSTSALFAFRVGQYEQAYAMLTRSLEIIRPLNEPRVLVNALASLGEVTVLRGDIAGSAERYEEGLRIARDIDDNWYEALCLTELAGVYRLLGKPYNFHEQFQSVVNAWHKTGDLRFTAYGLNAISMNAIAAGEYDRAYTALEESIGIMSSIGDRWGLARAYRILGQAAQAQGDHTQALDAFGKSLKIFTELSARGEVGRLLSEMAESTFALGNEPEAEHLWCESLQLAMETHGRLTTMGSIAGIARVKANRGNNLYALQLLLFITNQSGVIQETRDRAEKLVAEVKEKLTPEEIVSARTFAESKTLEAVVQEILEQAPQFHRDR